MADDAEHMSLDPVAGAAHGLAIDGKRAVVSAMGRVPCPQSGVELPRIDADQHVADHRQAWRYGRAVAAAHTEVPQHPGALIMDPLTDRLVAAHAAERRGGGKGEDCRQAVPAALAPPGVVDILEEAEQRVHVGCAEGHPGHSFEQGGLEVRHSEPPPPGVAAQRVDKHLLGLCVGLVALSAAREASCASGLDPVGGAVDRAPVTRRVNEGFDEKEVVAKAGRPVFHETACAQREHPGAEIAHPVRQNEEARVVGDQVQTMELHARVPTDPAVAGATLERRGGKHRQRQPAALMVRDIAKGLPHRRQCTEEVMRVHHLAKARFVL